MRRRIARLDEHLCGSTHRNDVARERALPKEPFAEPSRDEDRIHPHARIHHERANEDPVSRVVECHAATPLCAALVVDLNVTIRQYRSSRRACEEEGDVRIASALVGMVMADLAAASMGEVPQRSHRIRVFPSHVASRSVEQRHELFEPPVGVAIGVSGKNAQVRSEWQTLP